MADATDPPTETGSTDSLTDGSSDPPTEAGSTDSPTEAGSSDSPTDGSSGETRPPARSVRDRLRRAAAGVLFDLLVLTLWTVGLSLLFLAIGWPLWSFYVVLLAGAITFTGASTMARGRRR